MKWLNTLCWRVLPGLWVAILCVFIFTQGYADPRDFRNRLAHNSKTVSALQKDVEAEIRFGRDVAARILGRYPLYEDAALTRYVNLVGKALTLHASRTELDFHFAILDDASVNAYAVPGGYIFVTRGLLEVIADEAELAAALAHEIAHVTHKHIVAALNIQGSELTPQAGLTRLLGGAGDPTKMAFTQAAEKAVDILLEQGLQKDDELQSDRTAVTTLAYAGYDPLALQRLLARMDDLKGAKTEILNTTHPPMGERISALEQAAADLQLAGLDYPRIKERYLHHVRQ